MIRLTVPSIEEDDLAAVREAVASGYLVQGERVASFERELADLTGTTHAVAVANCTCALQLALLALDLRPGDICVVPAYSWISTANVVELCGARPVFVDIDERTFNIDVEKLADVLQKLMTSPETAGKVKAVVPVHAFGQMADMSAAGGVCAKWNIPIVEDAACALGATLEGRHAGSWGKIGCFSFHPRKAITTGEGGVVVTNDDLIARRIRGLRNHGQDPDAPAQDFVEPGFNYRLTEFQAALGLAQLSKLERITASRRRAASIYDEQLSGTALRPQEILNGAEHVYQSYVALLPDNQTARRNGLIPAAKAAGVETQIGTIHMPMTHFFRARYGYKTGDFPVADSVAARALTLPLYENITPGEQRTVVDVVLGLLD